MSCSFRVVEAADLELLLDLSAQLYGRDPAYWDPDRARRAAQELLASPQSGGMWLLEDEQQAVGYLVLTICFSLEFGGRFCLVDELFVSEESRGRGLGMQALEFATAWCRSKGMQALRLEVWTGNSGAIRLYERAGFALEERHLMTKRL